VTTVTPACQLYLVMESHGRAIAQLAACLDVGSVMAVLVRPASGQALDTSIARSLIELAQSRDVAVLVSDDPRAARTLRADGIHLSSGPDLRARFDEAREIVGTRAMIGVDPGSSRHAAMEFAELGADYIGFSKIESTEDDFDRDALLAWWSEIFQVPCVALDVNNPIDASTVAGLGVDFVAVSLPHELSASEATVSIQAYLEAINVKARVSS
jgi:thiamine-phosphate pyrophosphorylase